jgi:hypothetical protein
MSGEFGDAKVIQLIAGADLNTGGGTGAQFKAVAVGGTIAASSTVAIGLQLNKPKSGEDLSVGYSGHMKGVAGAAITAGARLIVTTSGYLITAIGAVIPCGRALATCASGASVEGLFDFTTAGVSSGP